jgi:hypothetical protein
MLPDPSTLGAVSGTSRYITLDGLVQLKLAAGRARDESDVVELIRANPDQVDSIRQSLARVHADYVAVRSARPARPGSTGRLKTS